MKAIAPSILSADFAHLADAVSMVNRSQATWLHVDVMDGVFVPNISFGFPVMEALRTISQKPLDVHLMITHPENYVERFCDAGAATVTFHLEAVADPLPILQAIRSKGVKTGLAINPDISEERLVPYLGEVDIVLIMSVFAGFGGQAFIDSSLNKIRFIRRVIDSRFAHGEGPLIEVDGGINAQNAGIVFDAGADVLVAGNAIFHSSNPEQVIATMANGGSLGE